MRPAQRKARSAKSTPRKSRATCRNVRTGAERAGVTLTVDAEGPVKLRGHRELLGQALANLVDNAIKHGGPVDGEKGEVRIRVARDGNEVTVIVADNGPGVPEVDRGRVLQRFTRLEKSRSTPGTGLGLSLVAALVKLAHGSIELTDARPGPSCNDAAAGGGLK